MADACECSNEPSGSVNCGEFFWLVANGLAAQEGLCTVEYGVMCKSIENLSYERL